jgi:hypothetical protein
LLLLYGIKLMEKIWKKRVNGIILEDLNGRVGEMM